MNLDIFVINMLIYDQKKLVIQLFMPQVYVTTVVINNSPNNSHFINFSSQLYPLAKYM